MSFGLVDGPSAGHRDKLSRVCRFTDGSRFCRFRRVVSRMGCQTGRLPCMVDPGFEIRVWHIPVCQILTSMHYIIIFYGILYV